jgi:predicted MFS family arabinose efflux permease
MGAIGMAVGGGAAASTALAGVIDDYVGNNAALAALAGVGLLATVVVWLVMPNSGPNASMLNLSSLRGYRRSVR